MRYLMVILTAVFLSALSISCYHSKHRPIDVYLTVESDYGSPNPPVGSNYRNYGMTITASVDSPVEVGEGIYYACTGWNGTGSAPPTGSTNSVTFVIAENSSITWFWNTTWYYLIVNGGPGEGWYEAGTVVNVSVDSPVAGPTGTHYVCAGWIGTGSVPTTGSTNSVSFIITQPSSITWVWKTQYELTTEILPEGSGTMELSPAGEDGYYDNGATVTLTANPNTGYAFGNWSGDLSGANNPETLTIDSPKNVIANFTLLAIYVDGASGQDTNDGLTWETAVKTIQKGIDIAPEGWAVLVADEIYTGAGNKNLDFAGKAIHLKSVGGAANCIIDCENSGGGFLFHSGETNDAIVEGFIIQNGSVDWGGGVFCDSGSPTFTNCIISGNSAAWDGGGVCCGYFSSPTFTNCTITNNTATCEDSFAGGVYCYYDSSPTFTNCTISGNSACYGGGVYCWGSSPTFTNCAISGNSATSGGSVCCSLSDPTFTNCAISGNSAYEYGGGVYCCSSSNPTFRNSIIWGNTANSTGNQIYVDTGSVTLSYSCYANGANDVADSGTITPDNCINTNPLFVGGGDYHLQAGSPCIDRGNNSYVPAGVTTDLDGNPRIQNGTVDLGAYEYQP